MYCGWPFRILLLLQKTHSEQIYIYIYSVWGYFVQPFTLRFLLRTNLTVITCQHFRYCLCIVFSRYLKFLFSLLVWQLENVCVVTRSNMIGFRSLPISSQGPWSTAHDTYFSIVQALFIWHASNIFGTSRSDHVWPPTTK